MPWPNERVVTQGLVKDDLPLRSERVELVGPFLSEVDLPLQLQQVHVVIVSSIVHQIKLPRRVFKLTGVAEQGHVAKGRSRHPAGLIPATLLVLGVLWLLSLEESHLLRQTVRLVSRRVPKRDKLCVHATPHRVLGERRHSIDSGRGVTAIRRAYSIPLKHRLDVVSLVLNLPDSISTGTLVLVDVVPNQVHVVCLHRLKLT